MNFLLLQLKKRFLQLFQGKPKRPLSVDELRSKAGLHAEEIVSQLLDSYCKANPSCRAIHNGQFEFDVPSAKPVGMEIDHVLITDKTVFIIETKYKSGEITALEHVPNWDVKQSGSMSSMPNALKQARRQQKILTRYFDSQLPIVPLVAIVGNAKLKRHNIHHVCLPDQLPSLIAMFNLYRPTIIDTNQMYNKLVSHLRK